MKTLLLITALLSVLAACWSCSFNTSRPGDGQPSDKETGQNAYLAGKVTEVRPEKDGYTARLITPDHQVYYATISPANLRENISQYRTVQVGDSIRLKGEIWKMGDENYITVRELL